MASLTMVAAIGLSACGGDDDGGGDGGGADSGAGGTVGATLQDFKITLDRSSGPSGKVTFEVQNDGPSTHEFVVFKTDLAADDLPTKDDGTVDEEGKGLKAVDEIEDIEKGKTPTLDVDLEPGSYVVICNLPAHYSQGMRASFEAT